MHLFYRSFNKEEDDSVPLYAQVNKFKKKKNREVHEGNMEDKTDNQAPRSSHKVEYTEVFINQDGDVAKPLMRRQTPVEYSNIVPFKVPSDVSNLKDEQRPVSDTPRFKIEESLQKRSSSDRKANDEEERSHAYENVTAIASKKVLF